MQINLCLDVDIPNNAVIVNKDTELLYNLDEVILNGDIISDSIKTNPDLVKEAKIFKDYLKNEIIDRLDGKPKPNHNFTSKGQVNIVLDINFDNETITVSGDSQGIYSLQDEMWMDNITMNYNPIILDSIKSNHDPVEKALFKVTEPEYYRILYHKEYFTEPDPQIKSNFSHWFKNNGLL